jgi:hypothetical protein
LRTGLLVATAWLLPAQNAPQPPKMLLIVREDIKEGKGAEHEQSESRFMRAAAAAKFPANILGLNSITGTAQAWFLEAYDSFDSIEKSRAAMHNPGLASLDGLDGEFRSGSRSSIAVYRPDLSYHGQQLMQSLPKMRYFNVITMRARPDHEQDFAELGKMAVAAFEQSMDEQPMAVYQIVSGAPNGTYIFLEPCASLKTLDAAPERAHNMFQAMGDGGAKRFTKMAGETIAQTETLLFAIDPKMSYVSPQIVAGDPSFWTPAEPSKDAKSTGKRSK